MKMNVNLGKLSPVLFLVTGVVWAAAAATGSGVLLFWPTLGSLVCAGLLFAKPALKIMKPLGAATAVFGLSLVLFQLYLSVSLAATGMATLAAYSIAVFSVMAVVYLVLTYTMLRPMPQKAA